MSSPHVPPHCRIGHLEGGWSLGSEELARGLVDAVGHGELEVLGEELLDVGAADIGGLLNLSDLENLFVEIPVSNQSSASLCRGGVLTWIDLKRERWRAAMSW